MYVEWRWEWTFEILPQMLWATLNTFLAAGVGYAIAAVVGIILMLGQRTPYKIVNIIIREIVEFIRSTPLLVTFTPLSSPGGMLPDMGGNFDGTLDGIRYLGIFGGDRTVP